MARARCDPFDVHAARRAIEQGASERALYLDYSASAARPYARSTFSILLRRGESAVVSAEPLAQHECDALADAESDAFWETRLKVKSRVVTTEGDSARLSVRGGALIVHDEERPDLRYDPGGRMPSAIVMAGWGGLVSVEALRFCASHRIAVLALDWMRELMAVMPGAPSRDAAILRAQALADRLWLASRIVQAKIRNAARVGALGNGEAARFIAAAGRARTVHEAMIAEAQAARVSWANPPAFTWRAGSPRIPPQWKLPALARQRLDIRSKQHATHPLNALLNVCFSVAAGRLTASLVAQGAHPAIGFLHVDAKGRFSLAFDAIEPLRPIIEAAVFAFVRKYQFSGNDFIRVRDARSSIRIAPNLLRVILADCAPSRALIDDAARAMIALIEAAPREPLSQSVKLAPPVAVLDPLAKHAEKDRIERLGSGAAESRLVGAFDLAWEDIHEDVSNEKNP